MLHMFKEVLQWSTREWKLEAKPVNIFGYYMNAQGAVYAGLQPNTVSFLCTTARIVDVHWEDRSLESMAVLLEHGGYWCQLWVRQELVPES